jgi:hypothetical protein
MNQLFRAALIIGLAWAGISTFKTVVSKIEEEELARLSAGESDFQRHHIVTANPRLKASQNWD